MKFIGRILDAALILLFVCLCAFGSPRAYIPDGIYLSDTNVFVVKHGPGSPNDTARISYRAAITGDSSVLYRSVDGVIDSSRGRFQLVKASSTMSPDTIVVGGGKYVGGWLEGSFWIGQSLLIGEIIHGSAVTAIVNPGKSSFTFTLPTTCLKSAHVRRLNLSGYVPLSTYTLTGRKLNENTISRFTTLVRCGNHAFGSYHRAP